MKVINKIAFLVHEPTMYAHYSSVWSAMDRDSFVIVLLGIFINRGNGNFGVKDFLNKVQLSGYEIAYLDELAARNIKYQYAVSNHIMGGTSANPASLLQTAKYKTKNIVKMLLNATTGAAGFSNKYEIQKIDQIQYPPLQAGIKQIRFMYGADISDAWSLDAWNEIYDLFLCHGLNDEMHLKKRFKGKTAIMGYPRYDGYFSPDLNINELYTEFNIDRNKQTILWMPTWDVFGDDTCSIMPFAKELSGLMDYFNVIVRPHPISLRVNLSAIELLESLHYKIDRDAMRDMNKIFKVADFVFCDHGGSPFGALYLGKKFVLLKTPSYDNSLMAKGSSNLELAKYFPVVSVDDIKSLRTLLNNTSYWQCALESSRPLCNKFFANNRGTSSTKAAEILNYLQMQ